MPLSPASSASTQELKPFGVKVLIVEPGQFRTGFAGAGLRHMPLMDAYKEVIGGTRDFARNMDGTQPGDPMKAAAAIETALESPNTPLRLQLGADAVDAIRNHAEALLSDLGSWEALARDTAFNQLV
jgi:NAD(P)-dependent dehydrogenase (short-subunit alcohol dehydrogenase family)